MLHVPLHSFCLAVPAAANAAGAAAAAAVHAVLPHLHSPRAQAPACTPTPS
jgi:hypothetical protein